MGIDTVRHGRTVEDKQYHSCKICDSNRLETLYTSAQSKLPVLRCFACGLVFVGQRFDDAQQTALYSDAQMYEAFVEAERSVVEKRGRHRAWADHIREQLQLLHVWGTHARPRLLDIGCGAGDFLAVAREQGFDVRGQEISTVAARLAYQSNKVHVDLIELSQIESSSADVVTLIGVLEHVMAPKDTLEQAYRILASKGRLFVYTPVWGTYDTVGTLMARISRNRFTRLADTRLNRAHLQIFARSTLIALLQKVGFTPLVCEAVCEYHLPVKEYLSWFGITQPRVQSVAVTAAQFLIDHKLFFRNNMRVLACRKS